MGFVNILIILSVAPYGALSFTDFYQGFASPTPGYFLAAPSGLNLIWARVAGRCASKAKE